MNLNDKIVIYRSADGQTIVDVRMDGDTVWLSQAQMAELFQKDRTVIGRHINNIYKEHELERERSCVKTLARPLLYFKFCYIFFWLCCFFLMHLATSCYIPIISGYK